MAVGWRVLFDEQTGAAIGYPTQYITPRPVENGTDYGGSDGVEIKVRRYRTTVDGIRTSFFTMGHGAEVARVNYRLDRSNRQVISYDLASSSTVYARADRTGEEWVGFVIRVQQVPRYDHLIGALSADFDASGSIATPDVNEMPTLRPLLAKVLAARRTQFPATSGAPVAPVQRPARDDGIDMPPIRG